MSYIGREICILLCFLTASQAETISNGLSATAHSRELALESQWSKELQDMPTIRPEPAQSTKISPVKRVVNLLEEMKAQLIKEADKEAEMYDEMVCWCETQEKEKTKAIADADAKDKELSAEIEERAARFGVLATEIEATKKKIEEDKEALAQAQAIRENEGAAFNQEEKDLVQTITNLKNAIEVLSKHHPASFLQMQGGMLASIQEVLRDATLKYELLMAAKPAPAKRGMALLSMASQTLTSEGLTKKLLHAIGTTSNAAETLPLEFAEDVLSKSVQHHTQGVGFLQASEEQPIYSSYSPQSSTIFGILTQMLEEFEAELKTSQKDELKSQEDAKAVIEAKTAEIEAAKKALDEMETEAAGNQKALSDAKEDLELTRKQRAQDVEFLTNLKVTCQNLDADWEERSKSRTEETKAVTEAIMILTEDDNREMWMKSVPAFMQLEETTNSEEGSAMRARRRKAAEQLRQAAQAPELNADDLLAAWHSRNSLEAPSQRMVGRLGGAHAQLSALAVSVQLDSFKKVKEMMDAMVADLKVQQKEEVEFKANCTARFDDNEKSTYEKTEIKEDLEVLIEHLATTIKTLEREIAEAKATIAETEVNIKKASQVREEENSQFQTVVADQRATQAILKKALDRLKSYYTEAKAGNEALLQNAQTPPVQFTKYKKNAGASPVMGLIEQIIEDSVKVESEAEKGEAEAQKDYETFVKDANALIAELSAAVTAKTKAIAAAKLETSEAEADHESTVDELETLAQILSDLHGECDFVMKNFEIRQRARYQEMESIEKAKAILSGSSDGAA